MNADPAAHGTRGVELELLAAVPLGPEIEGMAGRQLRMRRVTVEPGGVFGPVHEREERPGAVSVLRGTITDQRLGVSADSGPGAGRPEDGGAVPSVEIPVEVVRAA